MAKKAKYQLNLALQGGGAHGAFTWGVLDRLLEDEDIDIVGISGTSAGAINGALLVDGLQNGGREGAKQKLQHFWEEVSGASRFAGSMLHSPFGPMQINWSYQILDMLTRTFSPYELNPLNLNPLRYIIEKLVDFKNVQDHVGVKLFVTATNVETGQPRVFHCHEITSDVLLASGCLPFLFQAVEIEGVPFWDGGYMGNPSLWPLFYNTDCADILLVQINPLQRPGTPTHAIDIVNRLNEITFNSSLMAEMRAIQFVKQLIAQGKLSTRDYADVRMHMIDPPAGLQGMDASSKMNASWEFFSFMREAGRMQADAWIKKSKQHVGTKATIDIEKVFLATPHHAARQQQSAVQHPTKAGQSS